MSAQNTAMNDNLSSNEVISLDFHGSQIATFEVDGTPYVALRSVCEAIGIAWNGQFEKVKRDPVLSSTVRVTRTVAEDGRLREMSALPLDMLQGWLFKIDASRVRSSLRTRVIMFQRECYRALSAYWSHGVAAQPAILRDDLDGLVTGLSPDVERVIGGIFKKVIIKALDDRLDGMIEDRLARDPRMGAVTAIPALQVAVERGVAKRPRGFVQAVSNALTRYCECSTRFTVHRDVYGRKLFPREAINEWLAKGGWGPLKDRLDRQTGGQNVLRLVDKGAK
ncbi:phage antirepressor N-terminal domain-containing protein [Thalassospira sp. UBA1131]|uniref:phage antirepressor N-terminal domain-containing protein n=1 Tax=Thalassospira sp. UBA1131 TaxID=1947672 RepID=UPI0025D03329|nr:phage antirepressor N-terminal domain-containing protein [Thalassospira sp. UBA1131]